MIYLIEKIWCDYLENSVHRAVGYDVIGYVLSEEEAKTFCEKGRMLTSKDCWAIMGLEPEYRYKEVSQLSL